MRNKRNYFSDFIRRILINRFLIDIINFIFVRMLKLKKILDSSYTKSGKFVLIKKIGKIYENI